MGDSSPDGCGDDATNPSKIRVTSVKRPCPNGSDFPVAVPVPRVIRSAFVASVSMAARARGYSPRVAVDMAGAHTWVRYSDVVPTLRSLLLVNLKEETSRKAAREAIAGLYLHDDHPMPFHASCRFPAGEVYVCLDRAPVAGTMEGIVMNFVKAEAAEGYFEKKQFVVAWSNYISSISNALEVLTRADERVGSLPVLYDRDVFESAFLLTWAEP